MRTIKKYQAGGRISGKVPKSVKVDTSKVIKRMNKTVTPLKKKKDVDLSAPGKGMMEELKKKGAMPPSKKNVGRRGIKVGKAKGGKQMIKRADGSYSQRGLWDNIRANRGSGKKPTAQMLKQEKKIKAKSKK